VTRLQPSTIEFVRSRAALFHVLEAAVMKKSMMILVACLFPAIGQAADVTPWASGTVAWSTYVMSDVNDDIGAINRALQGSGLSMDEINGGFGFGLAAGAGLPGGLAIGVGYDRLTASSDVGDASGSLEYDFPANAFRFIVEYAFRGQGQVRARVGGAAGLVSEAGEVRVTATGAGSVAGDIDGTGPLFELFAGGDWWGSPNVALTGMVGFRYARATDVEVEGQPIYNASGDRYSVDYSGLLIRAGIRVGVMP